MSDILWEELSSKKLRALIPLGPVVIVPMQMSRPVAGRPPLSRITSLTVSANCLRLQRRPRDSLCRLLIRARLQIRGSPVRRNRSVAKWPSGLSRQCACD
jgi:hypothetical protein